MTAILVTFYAARHLSNGMMIAASEEQGNCGRAVLRRRLIFGDEGHSPFPNIGAATQHRPTG
jgi:hypothetical protein